MADANLPVARVQVFDNYVLKSRAQEHERTLMAAAAASGCAPPFALVGIDQIRMPRLTQVTPLLASATADELLAMARSLLECIGRLHIAGICHRDAHRDNFVLDGGRALMIDFELACTVDPTGLCYDLIGPASGITVPWQHEWLGMTQGVWWDSPTQRVRQLWQDFGHLMDVRGAR